MCVDFKYTQVAEENPSKHRRDQLRKLSNMKCHTILGLGFCAIHAIDPDEIHHILRILLDGNTDAEMLRKFYEYQTKAEIYHLYHSIQRYTVTFLL